LTERKAQEAEHRELYALELGEASSRKEESDAHCAMRYALDWCDFS
jgi:hypothetical protein